MQPTCGEDSSTDSDTTDDGNSEVEEENGMPKPVVVNDTDGDLYFCTKCTHEVVDGECTWIYCGLKHQWNEVGFSRTFPCQTECV